MRVLYTGGTGRMGVVIREGLQGSYEDVCLYARHAPTVLHDREYVVLGTLGDLDLLTEAARDVDVIVHLGGIADESSFDDILESNIVGTRNVYEAAKVAGVRRVVYASSNHVIGFHPVQQTLDPQAPMRPDTLYGLSKAYGELMGQLYHDKWGVESVCLRIGSFRPEPEDRRQLSTWLSHRDGISLFHRSIVAQDIGFLTAYGVSANTHSWWDNGAAAAALGYEPLDDAESFADSVEAAHQDDCSHQGGIFTADDYTGGAW